MKEHKAHYTSALIPLSSACTDCLNRAGSNDSDIHRDGTVSKDGTFAWLHTGPYLEVLSTQGGGRIAAWCFGAVVKDPNTTVTCCQEFKAGNSSMLLVGTHSSSMDLLIVFDIKSSRVAKAIQIPHEVASIEVVSSMGADQSAEHLYSPQLQYFSGILAVGTRGGHIYLLDLNLDDEEGESDEIKPASLRFLNPHVRDVASERNYAVVAGEHLSVQLGEDAHRRGYFYYKKPDDQTIKYFPSDEVSISNLTFIVQTGQLAVGYNFGCFQLWRLSIPVLEYSSRYDEDLSAVTHLAFQEPENDPRNFCYLWVARGPQPHQHTVDYNSVISLYQLGYNKRLWYDSFGYHFEELTSVGPRFEHELTTDPYNLTETSPGSRLVACCTVQDPNYNPSDRDVGHDSFEEGCGGPDLSLCVMVWEAGYTEAEPSCHLAVFDMNRWYHAQMPYAIRAFAGHQEACSFFAFYSLSDVLQACSPAGLLGVHVPFGSLSKFHSVAIPAPEQHFYPSSMSFDTCFLAENGLVQSKYLGIQRQFLAELQRRGPEAVADPTHMYSMCLYAGLLPRSIDTTSLQVHKREALLSAALDYGMMPFLTKCITQFGSGDFISRGCNLRFLVDWAWKKVAQVKDSVDKLCVPLYDWSGVPLDEQTLQLLHQQLTSLERLSTVFTNLLAQPTTDIGKQDLETKASVCRLIKQHVQVVLWFYSVGLLPEHSEEESDGLMRYSYPLSVLRDAYRSRRQHIHHMHKDIRSADVLHIDGLVRHVGPPLRDLLEKEGHDAQYPFPNFHCLLAMYLLEGVPVNTKHTLVFYALCDLYALVPEDAQQEFNDKMQQFTQAFAIPTSVQKFVQAIWLLDHKDFEDALLYLLDPCLEMDIAPWQHTLTIKALLYQAQHKLALKYIRVRQPPLVTPEDVKLRLTVLLANGLTSEAFEYQRLSRDQLNADDLLSHVFVGSQETKTVDQLLQLPLTEDEEARLVAHLGTSTRVHEHDLLVMYYLQRARFIEAIRLNTNIRQSFMNDMDPACKERAVTRNCIVDGYQRVLPRVQSKLAFHHDTATSKRARTRREFTRPRPLSMTVNKRDNEHTVTRASLLRHVLITARQIHQEEENQEAEDAAPLVSPDSEAAEKPGPFVCTPLTPRPARGSSTVTDEVIFPSTCTLHMQSMSERLTPQLAASAAASSPVHRRSLNSPLQPRITSIADALKAKRRLTSAAELALLQTPPVKRKTPRRNPLTPDLTATPQTPHSILKVRHKPLRRSPSPQIFAQSVKTQPDIALPTPPVFRSRFTSLPVSASTSAVPQMSPPASYTPNATGTPKHLRFSMPGGKDMEQEESEEGSEEEEGSDVDMSEEPMPSSVREATPPPPSDGWRVTPEREDSPSKDSYDEPPAKLAADTINTSPPRIVAQLAGGFDRESPMTSSSEGSPLQRRGIKDDSPNAQRHSPQSLSSLSPASTSYTQDKMQVDSDITFNFTKTITQHISVMEDADTEPLSGTGQATPPSLPLTTHSSPQANEANLAEEKHETDGEEAMVTDDEVDVEEDSKFAAFGSSLQIEVGMTRIDETCVVMKSSPTKTKTQVSNEVENEILDVEGVSNKDDIISHTKTQTQESNEVENEILDVDGNSNAGNVKASPSNAQTRASNVVENDILDVECESNASDKLASHVLKENMHESKTLETDEQIEDSNELIEVEAVDQTDDVDESFQSVSESPTKQDDSQFKNFVEHDVSDDRIAPAMSEENLNLHLEEEMSQSKQSNSAVPVEIKSDSSLVCADDDTNDSAPDSPSNKNVNNKSESRYMALSDVSVVVSPESRNRAEQWIESHQSRILKTRTILESTGSSSISKVSEMSASSSTITHVTNVSSTVENSKKSDTEKSSKIHSEGVATPQDSPVQSVVESRSIVESKSLPETNGKTVLVSECTKEQADSSDSASGEKAGTMGEKEQVLSARTTRSHDSDKSTVRTPTRKTKQEEKAITPTRRSNRHQAVAAAQTETKLTSRRSSRRQTASVQELPATPQPSNFKTPPHPTRLVLPPTPPESSPASTTSSVEPNDIAPFSARSRTRRTVGAPKRGKKTKARSRSSSPPVVSSTTEDVPVQSEEVPTQNVDHVSTHLEDAPAINGVADDARESDENVSAAKEDRTAKSSRKVHQNKSVRRSREVVAPLSDDSFMMNLRSGKRLSLSRDSLPISREGTPMSLDVKPSSRDVTPMSCEGSPLEMQRDEQAMEFTFSDPTKVHDFDENLTSTVTAANFVFSPPLTRGTSRRLSITPAPSPSASLIGLMPKTMTSSDQEDSAPVTQAVSPPKKARGRPKRTTKKSTTISVATDSPINFIPEVKPEDIDPAPARVTRMTLRTRTQPPPFLQRKRVRSIKKS